MSVMKLQAGTLLPTIASAYAAVEEDLERLSETAEGSSRAPVTIRPIDALLISLMAAYQPGHSHVIDLASEATCGASTVLCRTMSAARRVAVQRCSSGGWRFVMTRYLRDLDQQSAEMHEF